MSLIKYGVRITKRYVLESILLFSIFLTLYFVFSSLISGYVISSSDYRPVTQASFNFVIAITLILSSVYLDRTNKLVLIRTSSIITILMTVLLFFAPNDILRMAAFFVIGMSFSLGILGFLTHFWEITVPEERGRISGLIGFVALPFNFITAHLVAPRLDFLGTTILSIIFSLGIIVIVSLKSEKAVLTTEKNKEGNYFEKRTIFLYSIPWVLFSLINWTLARNASVIVSQQVSSSFYFALLGLQVLGVIFGSIIGGIAADFFGRRLSLGFSITLYGISTALLGVFTSKEVLSFVYALNGLSWGFLFILYIFVVWSDLANKDNCAKMYSIGLATYYLTLGIGLLTQIYLSLAISSLLICLTVFISNISILMAPELLSPYFRERMKMRLHMKAVKKISNQSKN
jgi:predicted MFS family arabinose efflux permease